MAKLYRGLEALGDEKIENFWSGNDPGMVDIFLKIILPLSDAPPLLGLYDF
jgi:hypothetical protein